MHDSSLWEPVIGLEIHVELSTRSKLFSTAPNHFGDDPNMNITEVCTGQPGALPVLNKEAVKYAILLGHALKSKISPFSSFDRKSYFYPDSPRNFQITQYEHPILIGGNVTALVDDELKEFTIARAHLEDDAGMLKHFSTFAGVDYNRAGVPLIEIVSQPCMHSAKDASSYAKALKAIIEYLGISDCNMEEGSLRMDVNVSVRPKGELTLRPKVEIKNMNSFTFMEQAIGAEIKRQVKAYLAFPDVDPKKVVPQSTYRFDPERKETILMRRKEEADDYRYFPEPDLVPIVLSSEYISSLSSIPELPLAKRTRYIQELSLTPAAADLLTQSKALANYFEEALRHTQHATALCNWITVEFQGRFKDTGQNLLDSNISPIQVAKLVNLIHKGTITGKIAKSIADEMVISQGRDPEAIIASNPNYRPIDNTSEIEAIIDRVLEANPEAIVDFKAGKDRSFGFLVGQVMKQTAGKASPTIVNDILKKKLV